MGSDPKPDGQLAQAFFQGVARLPMKALNFDHDLFRQHHRPVSGEAVNRLSRIFEKESFRRDDSRHWIDAIVDIAHLESVIASGGLSRDDLRSDAEHHPFLELEAVDCLQGVHRIQAAKDVLAPSDWWWTVRLYSKDIPRRACVEIIEGTLNEQPFEDGEIVRKILLYNRQQEERPEQKWWARLSEGKRNDLKQLLGKEPFRRSFANLADMPGLWSPVKIGALRRILTLRCDEESLHYLSHVFSTWSTVISAAGVAPQAVDRDTVAKLELLAPAASGKDRELVEEYVASGDVFRGVVDPTARAALLSTIRSLPGLIPSLRSFCENLKYLEPCCHIIKQIVPAKRGGSIYQTLADAYSAPDEQVVEYAEGKRKKRPRRGVEEGLWLSYVQLWAFCMRHFPSMTHIAPRKEPRGRKPSTCSESSLLHDLGSLASALGFRTKEALKLRDQDPHAALADRLLGTVRSVSDSDAGLVARMASVLRQRESAPRTAAGSGLARDGHFSIRRRCGRPFEDDFAEDQESLFVPLIYEAAPSGGPDISPFFVKRDLFFSFFGNKYEKVDESLETYDDDGSSRTSGQAPSSDGFGADGLCADRASVGKAQELAEALRKEKQQSARLRRQKRASEVEIERLEREVEQQSEREAQLERASKGLQMAKAALESSAKSTKLEAEGAQQEARRLRAEKAGLEEHLASIGNELRELRGKHREKEDKAEEVERKLQELQAALHSSSNSLKLEVETHRQAASSLRLEKSDQDKALLRVEREAGEARARLDGLDRKAKGLEAANAALKDSSSLLEHEVEKRQRVADNVKNEKEGLEKEFAAVSQRLREAEDQLRAKSSALKELRRELSDQSERIEELENDRDRSAMHPQPPGQPSEQDLARAYEEMRVLQAELRLSQATAQDALMQVSRLEERLQKARENAREDRANGESQGQNFERTSQREAQLEAALAKAVAGANEAQKALAEAEEEVSKARSTVSEQKGQLEALRAAASAQGSEISSLKSQLFDVKKAWAGAGVQLEEAVNERDDRIKRMHLQIQELRGLMNVDLLRSMTSEEKALVDLLLISLRIRGEYIGIFAIDAATCRIMIAVPDRDPEETITRILQAIDKAGQKGELLVMCEMDDKLFKRKVKKDDYNPTYIKRELHQRRFFRFFTESNIRDEAATHDSSIDTGDGAEAAKKGQYEEQDGEEVCKDCPGRWRTAENGKRQKLDTSNLQGNTGTRDEEKVEEGGEEEEEL